MKKVAMSLVLVALAGGLASAGILSVEFSCGTGPLGEDLVLNDVMIDTAGADWLSSLVYAELESGWLYQDPLAASLPWGHIAGLNDADSWLAENVSVFGAADELAGQEGMSGDAANAGVSITVIAETSEDPVPPWDGFAMRLAFDDTANGTIIFTVSAKGMLPVMYVGIIDDGVVCVPGGPKLAIPDISGDGYIGSADLDIVRANWGRQVSAGSLAEGDLSGDGLVGSADLDIIRGSWGQFILPGIGVPDVSGDGVVDIADLDIVHSNWECIVEPGATDQGDANGDGIVCSADLDIVRANWEAGATAAPEPSTVLLVVVGSVLFVLRRRR